MSLSHRPLLLLTYEDLRWLLQVPGLLAQQGRLAPPAPRGQQVQPLRWQVQQAQPGLRVQRPQFRGQPDPRARLDRPEQRLPLRVQLAQRDRPDLLPLFPVPLVQLVPPDRRVRLLVLRVLRDRLDLLVPPALSLDRPGLRDQRVELARRDQPDLPGQQEASYPLTYRFSDPPATAHGICPRGLRLLR